MIGYDPEVLLRNEVNFIQFLHPADPHKLISQRNSRKYIIICLNCQANASTHMYGKTHQRGVTTKINFEEQCVT